MKTIILGFLLIIVILGLLYYFKNVKEGLTLANPDAGLEGAPTFNPKGGDIYIASGGNYIDAEIEKYTLDYWNTYVVEPLTRGQDGVADAMRAIYEMNRWGQSWILEGMGIDPNKFTYPDLDTATDTPQKNPDGTWSGRLNMPIISELPPIKKGKSWSGKELEISALNPITWKRGTQRGFGSNSTPKGFTSEGRRVPSGQGGNMQGVAGGDCTPLGCGKDAIKFIFQANTGGKYPITNIKTFLDKEKSKDKRDVQELVFPEKLGDYDENSQLPPWQNPMADGDKKYGPDDILQSVLVVSKPSSSGGANINGQPLKGPRGVDIVPNARTPDITAGSSGKLTPEQKQNIVQSPDGGILPRSMAGHLGGATWNDPDKIFKDKPLTMYSQGANSKKILTREKVVKAMQSWNKIGWKGLDKNIKDFYWKRETSPEVALLKLSAGEWDLDCQNLDYEILALKKKSGGAVSYKDFVNKWQEGKRTFLEIFRPSSKDASLGPRGAGRVASPNNPSWLSPLENAYSEMVAKPWISTKNSPSSGASTKYRDVPGITTKDPTVQPSGFLVGTAMNFCDAGSGPYGGLGGAGGVSIVVPDGDDWVDDPTNLKTGTKSVVSITTKDIVFDKTGKKLVGEGRSGTLVCDYNVAAPGMGLNEGMGSYLVGAGIDIFMQRSPIQAGVVGDVTADPVRSTVAARIAGLPSDGITKGKNIGPPDFSVPGRSDKPDGPPDGPTDRFDKSCWTTWTDACRAQCNGMAGEGCKKQLLGEDPYDKIDEQERKDMFDRTGNTILTSGRIDPTAWPATGPDGRGGPVGGSTKVGALATNQFLEPCWKQWDSTCVEGIKEGTSTVARAKVLAIGTPGNVKRPWLMPHDKGGPLPADDGIATWLEDSTPGLNPRGIGNIINYIANDGSGRKSIVYTDDVGPGGEPRWETRPEPPTYGTTNYGPTYNMPPTYGTTYNMPPTYGTTYNMPPTYGTTYNMPPTYGTNYGPINVNARYGKQRRRKSSRRRRSPRRKSFRRKSRRGFFN